MSLIEVHLEQAQASTLAVPDIAEGWEQTSKSEASTGEEVIKGGDQKRTGSRF